MRFEFDDGGRVAAGFKGRTGDCVCRAIAIATGEPYRAVYMQLAKRLKAERRGNSKRGISSPRNGVYRDTTRKFLASLGWRWVPTMRVGQGCKVHLREDELPSGRLLVSVSRHLVAVIDGVIHDTHDPSRDGNRCVYGYYEKA